MCDSQQLLDSQSILPVMHRRRLTGGAERSALRSGAGMAVLVGTYGARDGAADERTPPGLGG